MTVHAADSLPWYRQVSREQWRAFSATFFGWVLDGFDATIVTLVLIDIQRAFSVDRALAGALGTVTLLMRLPGGALAGALADRYGRKLPLMLSILWFSLFGCLSGFSTSYAMLFAFRALFGIGMGGEWAAGMPLVLEHWPSHLRGIASGLLQGGYSWGFILSAAVFHFLYPSFSDRPDLGWRVMFWIGIVPALFVLWIRRHVSESPVWLERRRLLHAGQAPRETKVSFLRIFQRDLLATTLHTSLMIGTFMFLYYSISFWYPTFLRERGFSTLPYLVAVNFGGIVGCIIWGRLSETRLGRRGAITVAALAGVAMVPFYLQAGGPITMALGALLIGATGAGIFGVAPSYVTERFPTSVRGAGAGFAYHAGAALGALTPTLLGALQDQGWTLAAAMSAGIVASGGVVAVLTWLGPETRGRSFTARE